MTRNPPSTGTARVAMPLVAPGLMPSENGWLWIFPSSTIPRKSSARIRSWRSRCSSVMVRRSATGAVQSVVATCMLKVSAVAPQWRPISSDTRT